MAKMKRPPVRRQQPSRIDPSQVVSTQQKGPLLTSADLKAMPILRSPVNEKMLVDHILARVRMSDDERRRRAARAQDIDVQMSGYITLSADDKKRKNDNRRGRAPKPTDHNLCLTMAQLDEGNTYLMSVFAPEMDIFEAVAPADKQQLAQALTAEVNKHSQHGQYYRHISKACFNALKYNFMGLTCYWEKYNGVVFASAPGGVVSKTNGTVWEGNVLNSVDVYNFFYDTAVHPVDLPKQGEFFAEVERRTPFRVRKMASDNQLYGINRYVKENFSVNSAGSSPNGFSFYLQSPSVRDPDSRIDGNVNWVSVVRGDQAVQESVPGIELVWYTGWINPTDFGLSTENELQVWRICVANAKYLTFAVKLQDNHGMLPIAMACPLEDDLKNEQRTYAEQLIPLQHFASFLLNAHQAATRKSIYGVTVYNANLFPGMDKDRDELIGAILPFRSTSAEVDIDKAFRHYSTAPGTERNVQQVGEVIQLMQKILPTDMLKQVADLERATLYQAAATVQAGNRRQLKLARIISDQCLQLLKFQMLYNLYANLPTLSYVDEITGKRQDISVGDCVAAGVEFDISTGLKGLDRLMTIQIMRDVINSVIQSQQGIAEIDIVKLLNYYSNLAGDRTDLTQFRKQPTVNPGQTEPGATPPPGPANPGLKTPQVPGA